MKLSYLQIKLVLGSSSSYETETFVYSENMKPERGEKNNS